MFVEQMKMGNVDRTPYRIKDIPQPDALLSSK